MSEGLKKKYINAIIDVRIIVLNSKKNRYGQQNNYFLCIKDKICNLLKTII
jgi:hypothetical protein